jgi:hypothetical protein
MDQGCKDKGKDIDSYVTELMSDRNFYEVLEGTKKIAWGACALVIAKCGQP